MEKKQYFFIDTYNTHIVKSELYGYSVTPSGIIESLDQSNKLGLNGAYVHIERNKDSIVIRQDYMGSMGLFLYKHMNYFAISNSFLYLLTQLDNNLPLSLNNDYANTFLQSQLNVNCIEKTLVNEVELLSRESYIEINLKTNTLQIKNNDNVERVSPFSKKAIDILDNWFNRWTTLIKNVGLHSDNIRIDLSGGFDSRIIFGLFLKSGIDLNKVHIKSNTGSEHTFIEDYEIASKIASDYSIKLNEIKFSEKNNKYFDINYALDNSMFMKLGLHKQFYLKTFFHMSRKYTFSGGGLVRYYRSSSKELYDAELPIQLPPEIRESKKRLIDYSLNTIQSKTIDDKWTTVDSQFYLDTRGRHHIGRSGAESYISNELFLYPLCDYQLKQIETGLFDLQALIYVRFFPELLNYPFEGNRAMPKDVISKAEKINIKYKQNPKYLTADWYNQQVNESFLKDTNLLNEPTQILEYEYYIRNIIQNPFSMILLKKYLSNTMYGYANKLCYSAQTYNNLDKIGGVFSLITILDIIYKHEQFSTKIFLKDFLKSNVYITPELVYHATLRIDLKINGQVNPIDIESNDENLLITKPGWFQNEGIGYVTYSNLNWLFLKIKPEKEGKLHIRFRGYDSANDRNERNSYWLIIDRFDVNNTTIIDSPKEISHDNPFTHKLNVKPNNIIKLFIAWKPADYSKIQYYNSQN